MATTMVSKRPNGTGRRPGFSRTSQLRVKLGTMRPPISAISSTTTAMPARMAMSALPWKCASRWKAILPASSSRTSITTARFRQLRPATISRAAASATSSRKLASISIAGSQPVSAENVTPSRPAIQTATSTINGRAPDRQPSGPVRDRREQEPGDHSRQIAVEHLVHMPVARREGRGQGDLAMEGRQPDQDRKARIDRPEQEERPEAVRKQHRAIIGLPGGNASSWLFLEIWWGWFSR